MPKAIRNVILSFILGVEDLPQIRKKKLLQQKIADLSKTKLE